MLAFAALTLIRMAAELIWGDLNSVMIPEDVPENILMITKIILMSITLLLLLPRIYIGMKGLRVTEIDPAEYSNSLFPDGVYHLYDYQFLYRNF